MNESTQIPPSVMANRCTNIAKSWNIWSSIVFHPGLWPSL